MRDDRLIKMIASEKMDGKSIRGSDHTLDDITDWRDTELHQLAELAQAHTSWRQTVSRVLDTNWQ